MSCMHCMRHPNTMQATGTVLVLSMTTLQAMCSRAVVSALCHLTCMWLRAACQRIAVVPVDDGLHKDLDGVAVCEQVHDLESVLHYSDLQQHQTSVNCYTPQRGTNLLCSRQAAGANWLQSP